jgi:hypothetical protein
MTRTGVRRCLLTGIVGMLLECFAPNPSTAHNLSRGWVTINLTKSDCIVRARSALAIERIAVAQATQDFVFWDGMTVGAIHCLPISSQRTTAFIVVYSEDNAKARQVRDLMYTYMQKGAIEG